MVQSLLCLAKFVRHLYRFPHAHTKASTLCSLFWWSYKVDFDVNVWLHSLRPTFRKHVALWWEKLDWLEKLLLHRLQLYGFIPVWEFRWSARSCFLAKSLLHWSKGQMLFLSMCGLLWAMAVDFLLNDLPQTACAQMDFRMFPFPVVL